MPDRPRLPCWVVTGPIGAGKSLAVEEFAHRGAAVVDADRLGHAVLRDPDVVAALRDRWGPGILAGGEVDRAAVARRVFADPGELAWLESVTHPRLAARIGEAVAAAARRDPLPPLAVVEAAVYFRLPPWGPVDLVVVVTAPERLRLERLAASGRLTPEEARARIASQRPLEAAFRRADVALDNSGGPASLRAAVRRLLHEHGLFASTGGADERDA